MGLTFFSHPFYNLSPIQSSRGRKKNEVGLTWPEQREIYAIEEPTSEWLDLPPTHLLSQVRLVQASGKALWGQVGKDSRGLLSGLASKTLGLWSGEQHRQKGETLLLGVGPRFKASLSMMLPHRNGESLWALAH